MEGAKEYTVTQEEVEAKRKRAGANIPATTVKMGKMVDDYWEEIRRAPAEGKKVAWHVAIPGTLLTYAAGMPTLMHAAFAPYCTGRRQEEGILQLANEDYGFLPDTCSYVRVHAEVARLQMAGKADKLEPSLRIPKPDIMICGRNCTEHSTLAELVARNVGCPIVFIDGYDGADCTTEQNYKRFEDYLQRQIKEDVIPAIEQVTGKPYPYDKLSEMVWITKQVATIRDEITTLMKNNRPSPCSMFDLGISIGSLIAQLGRPETVQYYQDLLDELKERVEKGIGVLPEEKYRFYWDGYTTWSMLGTVMRIVAPKGGIPIMGRYISAFWREPELLDPDEPIKSMTHVFARWPINYPPFAKKHIMDTIEEYQLDGMIMTSFATCRMWNVGQHEFVEEAERRFGIPSLIFPCDMIDRTYINEAQLKTRLEAFMEMIDARRARFGR